MVELDREGLELFIRRGEKRPPPVFAGRQDVLDDIVSTAELAWKDREEGFPGNTRIIQGAPGAGKSSILAELQKRLNAGRPQPGKPRILVLDSSGITDPAEALRRLAEMVNPDRADSFLAAHQHTHSVAGQAGAFGSSVSGRKETSRTLDSPSPSLLAFEFWLRARSASEPGRQQQPEAAMAWPVIIAVDEAQRLPADRNVPPARLLQGLHASLPDLPLTLVLSGLGDTENVATSMDLTRGKEVHRIGCLEEDDVHELMTGFCAHFGIGIGSCGARLMALAGPTDGWPRHLHCVQEALAAAVLEEGVDGDLDRIGDWDSIGAESLRRRNDYYRSQTSEEMDRSRQLVAAVMKGLEEGARADEVISLIEANARDEPRWRLPKGMDSDQFYRHLVHRGALEKGDDSRIRCPIPSFRRHLVREAQPAPEPLPAKRWNPGPGRGRIVSAAAELQPRFDRRQVLNISYHAEFLVDSHGRPELEAWARHGRPISEDRLRAACRSSKPTAMEVEAWGEMADEARGRAVEIAVAEVSRRRRQVNAILDHFRRGRTAREDHAALSGNRVKPQATEPYVTLDLLSEEESETRTELLMLAGMTWHRLVADGGPIAIRDAGPRPAPGGESTGRQPEADEGDDCVP